MWSAYVGCWFHIRIHLISSLIFSSFNFVFFPKKLFIICRFCLGHQKKQYVGSWEKLHSLGTPDDLKKNLFTLLDVAIFRGIQLKTNPSLHSSFFFRLFALMFFLFCIFIAAKRVSTFCWSLHFLVVSACRENPSHRRLITPAAVTRVPWRFVWLVV